MMKKKKKLLWVETLCSEKFFNKNGKKNLYFSIVLGLLKRGHHINQVRCISGDDEIVYFNGGIDHMMKTLKTHSCSPDMGKRDTE